MAKRKDENLTSPDNSGVAKIEGKKTFRNLIGDLREQVKGFIKGNEVFLLKIKKMNGVEKADIDEAEMVIQKANDASAEIMESLAIIGKENKDEISEYGAIFAEKKQEIENIKNKISEKEERAKVLKMQKKEESALRKGIKAKEAKRVSVEDINKLGMALFGDDFLGNENDTEFENITDEKFGVRGEGQRKSLENLYEKARRLGTDEGVELMEKIQMKLDELDGGQTVAVVDQKENKKNKIVDAPQGASKYEPELESEISKVDLRWFNKKSYFDMSSDELRNELREVKEELGVLDRILTKTKNPDLLKNANDMIVVRNEYVAKLEERLAGKIYNKAGELVRDFSLNSGIDEETAEEIGVDGWEHNITPFTSKEEKRSVFQEEDYEPTPIPQVPSIRPIPQVPQAPRVPKAEKMPTKINIVSIDEIVRSYARRMSEEKVRGLMDGDGNIFKRSWVRMAEDGYRYKYEKKIIESITNNQNLQLEIESSYSLGKALTSNAGRSDINYEILNQIIAEHSSNVQEQSEIGEAVTDPLINARFQSVISRYCLADSMDRDQFDRSLRDEIASMKKDGLITDENFLGKARAKAGEKHEGFMYASNLFEVAEAYKAEIANKVGEIKKENNLKPEQEEALKKHIQGTLLLDIKLGSKLADLHNKQPLKNFGAIESIVSFFQRTPILNRIASNPGTLAIFASAGLNVVSRKVLGGALKAGTGVAIGSAAMVSAWAPILGAAATAGAFAFFRRSKEVKQDAAMHKRQKALGQEFTGKRREKLDKFDYQTRSATELLNQLTTIQNSGDYANLPAEQKQQIVEMYARFKVELDRDEEFRTGGKKNNTVDLISVDEKEGDTYGTNVMSKTKLKMGLWNYLRENRLISEQGRDINNKAFEELVNASCDDLNKNITEADKKLNSYRRMSALTSGVIGAATGAITAIGFQEAWSFIQEHVSGKPSFTALDTILHPNKINQVFPKIGDEILTPGKHDVLLKDSYGKDQIAAIFVNKEGVIDQAQSKFPDGWKFDGASIVAPGYVIETDISNNLEAIGREVGVDSRNVSYHGFYDHFTNPAKGMRALVETAKNLAHNLGLRADKTELLMDFKADAKGNVNLDLSKFLGKTLEGNGLNKTQIEELLESGRVKLNFAFDNSAGGTQNHPLSIAVNETITTLPEKFAKLCTSVNNGIVSTKGLITLTIDDGIDGNGHAEVVSIASIFKEFNDTIMSQENVPGITYDITPGQGIDIAPAVGVGMAPRLAPEGRKKKNENGDSRQNPKNNNEDIKILNKDKQGPGKADDIPVLEPEDIIPPAGENKEQVVMPGKRERKHASNGQKEQEQDVIILGKDDYTVSDVVDGKTKSTENKQAESIKASVVEAGKEPVQAGEPVSEEPQVAQVVEEVKKAQETGNVVSPEPTPAVTVEEVVVGAPVEKNIEVDERIKLVDPKMTKAFAKKLKLEKKTFNLSNSDEYKKETVDNVRALSMKSSELFKFNGKFSSDNMVKVIEQYGVNEDLKMDKIVETEIGVADAIYYHALKVENLLFIKYKFAKNGDSGLKSKIEKLEREITEIEKMTQAAWDKVKKNNQAGATSKPKQENSDKKKRSNSRAKAKNVPIKKQTVPSTAQKVKA